MKYSLGTQFTLSKTQIDCSTDINANTVESAFFDQGNLKNGTLKENRLVFIKKKFLFKEDKVYGTVIWTGVESSIKKSAYKLDLEQVYICSTINTDEFIPTYDPDGSIYNEGPQFGCSKSNKLLKHRILLLNREKITDYIENEKFQAKFITNDLNTF